jgi:hypothetical protein
MLRKIILVIMCCTGSLSASLLDNLNGSNSSPLDSTGACIYALEALLQYRRVELDEQYWLAMGLLLAFTHFPDSVNVDIINCHPLKGHNDILLRAVEERTKRHNNWRVKLYRQVLFAALNDVPPKLRLMDVPCNEKRDRQVFELIHPVLCKVAKDPLNVQILCMLIVHAHERDHDLIDYQRILRDVRDATKVEDLVVTTWKLRHLLGRWRCLYQGIDSPLALLERLMRIAQIDMDNGPFFLALASQLVRFCGFQVQAELYKVFHSLRLS